MHLLQETIAALTQPGKGILAADESITTMTKRLENISVTSTEETRRAYRTLMLSTPRLNEYISGVILFEETLQQRSDDGQMLADLLHARKILPGIKVDKGLISLAGTHAEKITQGLDGLPERLEAYSAQGARFAKWRAVFSIGTETPSSLAIEMNAYRLADYAAICQSKGMVPIVEPEVLMDGDHDIDRSAAVTEAVLHTVFHALYEHRVALEYIVLKPSMVIAGKNCPTPNTIEEVAAATLRVLRRTVPAAVPTINFLSGGQSPEQATAHLNAMNQHPQMQRPWKLSFSYGRALQEPCLKAWAGAREHVEHAQTCLRHRAECNSAATQGLYESSME